MSGENPPASLYYLTTKERKREDGELGTSEKRSGFQHISEKFHISPRVASLIRNRDVIGDDAIEKYLNGTIADLYDGMLMKDMDKAVAVLGEKIKENVKIRIIGDYDIDGIQSTYILLEGFRMLGADVDSDIPDRMKDGYGLNRNLIDPGAGGRRGYDHYL